MYNMAQDQNNINNFALLQKAITKYYNSDKSLLSDATYDILETILKPLKNFKLVYQKMNINSAGIDIDIKLPRF